MTINGLVYQAVDGTKPDNTKFNRLGGNAATAADLGDSITSDTRIGTDEPTVDLTASVTNNEIIITSSLFGTIGNNVEMFSLSGTLIPITPTLTGGRNPDEIVATALFSTPQNLASLAEFYAPVDLQRECGRLPL